MQSTPPYVSQGGRRKNGCIMRGEVSWRTGKILSPAGIIHPRLGFKMMKHLRPLGLGIEAINILGTVLQRFQSHTGHKGLSRISAQ